MQKKTVANISLKNLKYLPAFAEFLLGRLREYAENQLRLSREIDLPLLKVLKGKTDEQLIEMSMKSGGELLTYLAQNKADEQIEAAVILWKKNQLPHIDQKDIVAEDINLVNFVRKRNFLHFIKSYTQDVPTIFALTEEIDRFVMKSELESTNTYIDLLRNHIREQSYLNEKITNTSPGIIYLFNLGSNSISFVNETAEEFFGMSREDFVALGNRVLEKLIYHEDIGLVLDLLSDVVREGNKEDWSLELRLKKENNEYLWMRNYVSVFKKDEHGRPVELIGNLINIHSEKETAEQLRRSEERYRQAAQLSQIGHFTLNLHSKDVYFTEELNHIYELDPRKSHHKYEEVIKFRHPDDESVVRNKLEECFRTRQPFNFHFRIVTESKKEKTLHTQGGLVYNRNGDPIELVGTVQDVSERQTLIQQLQESEKLHQQAQSLAHLGNWSLDLATMNYTWSEQMYTIYEMQKQDYFAAKEWEKYIHPEDKKEVLDYFETCLKNKTPYDKIHRIVLKNGTVKVLHRKGEFVLDSNDEPVRLIGTTQDITEQYRVQQELKENQTFIRKIADATPSIITSYNINSGKYVFVSEGLQKLLGYDPAEALRDGVQFFFKLIHPDDISELTTRNNEALQQANEHPERNDLILEFTYRMKHQNGKYRWFHTYGTIFDRNSNGHVEHVLNISLDVTEQIEASKKIEEQEHFIQHIADASPTILYVYDVAKDCIAYVNREIFFVLGYTPDEILGMRDKVVETLYHPDDIPLLPERKLSDKKILETDIMLQYECRIKNKEGEWQWFLVREVVFKTTENEKVSQIVGAALDISKRKDMERVLLQNSFQLEQSNASLEEFAYVASHDLKEPLRKISTFGDRLEASQADNLTPEGKLYLNKIVDASQRMQVMINDLLAISMISGNKSFENYSLQKIFEEVLQTLEFKIEQKNAIVTSDNLPAATIIPSQFRQLFQNLLSNSLKFARENVQPFISITHSYVSPKDVHSYQLGNAEQYLKIALTDNGIGFENEYAQRIFAIFQRLHGRSEYEGSGIGLAICKKIVEHHGGIIYASGNPDSGASFTIILPA